MSLKSIIAATALLTLAGCATDNSSPQAQPSSASQTGSAMSRDGAIAIARKYISNERSDWDRALSRQAMAIDQGEVWQVTFHPERSPVILVEKKTGKVVDAHE